MEYSQLRRTIKGRLHYLSALRAFNGRRSVCDYSEPGSLDRERARCLTPRSHHYPLDRSHQSIVNRWLYTTKSRASNPQSRVPCLLPVPPWTLTAADDGKSPRTLTYFDNRSSAKRSMTRTAILKGIYTRKYHRSCLNGRILSTFPRR